MGDTHISSGNRSGRPAPKRVELIQWKCVSAHVPALQSPRADKMHVHSTGAGSLMNLDTNPQCFNTHCQHKYCTKKCTVERILVNVARDRTPEGW